MNQCSDAWVSWKSSQNRVDSSPSQSLQARYFWSIQASNPAGESARTVNYVAELLRKHSGALEA